MAVNSMANMPIRIVVMTCPRASWLTTPKMPIGATGWTSTMP